MLHSTFESYSWVSDCEKMMALNLYLSKLKNRMILVMHPNIAHLYGWLGVSRVLLLISNRSRFINKKPSLGGREFMMRAHFSLPSVSCKLKYSLIMSKYLFNLMSFERTWKCRFILKRHENVFSLSFSSLFNLNSDMIRMLTHSPHRALKSGID